MDIQITNHGSIFLFAPLTNAASDWIDENVDPGAQWLGGSLAVEPRYASDLANGMADAGLDIS
jgi:hypothetical protein